MPRRAVASIVIVTLMNVTAYAAPSLFVDAEATGPAHDGASWCSAFRELHEALAVAPPGATIRIADGVYLPDPTGLADSRYATFVLPGGVILRGGHAGCGAPDPDHRDPVAQPTVLSGDLNGDDPTGHLDDNVYTVVTAESLPGTVILDGLTIRAGHGVGDGLGGGIRSLASTLYLITCTLQSNRTWRGGGIYAEGGDLECHLCRFVANTATGEGGAIFHATTRLVLDNCLFAVNVATSDGGAIFSDLASVQVTNCSLGGNTSGSRGGAIYDYVGVETSVGNSILWGNTDSNGSGEQSQLFINPSNFLQVDHTCVQGWTGAFGGVDNHGEDPLLAEPAAGDLHLSTGSPCIDAGDNGLVFIQVDLDGNPRIAGGTVDQGCYEFPVPTGVAGTMLQGRILGVAMATGGPGQVIRYLPPDAGTWSIEVFDLRGRRLARVAEGVAAGPVSTPQEVSWNGRDGAGRPVASGVYLLALRGRHRILDTRKVGWTR